MPLFYSMKCLYVCNTNMKKKETISQFSFKKHIIYTTRFDKPSPRFKFILDSYNFDTLIANIEHDDIHNFLQWKKYYFPSLQCSINIYNSVDETQSLYELGTDTNLLVRGYFFKTIKPILHMVTG